MATTFLQRRNGHGETCASTPSPPGGRRRQGVLISAGALLVVLFALLGALLVSSSGDEQLVLVAARDIEAGATITDADLTTAAIPTDTSIGSIGADDRGAVVGLVASGPLQAGSVLHPEAVATSTGLGPGEAVVSAVLEVGAAPPGLRPGSRVVAVTAGPEGAQSIGEAAVFDVATLDDGLTFLVSLQLDVDEATSVAAAAGRGDLRLLLVGDRETGGP